jgi:flagellin-specific chaperone FliS
LRADLFENRMLKRIFRLSGKEIAGDLINLYNYEFHHLNSSLYINGVDEMDGLVAPRSD